MRNSFDYFVLACIGWQKWRNYKLKCGRNNLDLHQKLQAKIWLKIFAIHIFAFKKLNIKMLTIFCHKDSFWKQQQKTQFAYHAALLD